MALNTDIAQTAIDFNGLAELRRSATEDKHDGETLRQVAGQFESLFVTMMLKSMRQTHLAQGIFDNNQSEMYQEMSDQQLAIDLSAKGGLGLQDVIMRQLDQQLGHNNESTEAVVNTLPNRPESSPLEAKIRQLKTIDPVTDNTEEQPVVTAITEIKATALNEVVKFDSPEEFVQQLWPMAKQAADKLGVAPEALLAQAALETGWGKHIIKTNQGGSSHNLFNIKADSRWQGGAAAIKTVEYRDGIAVKEEAKFRSYPSYQDSFNDYVDFLQRQPRYQDALKQVHDPEKFIEGLHKAGYATDPNYADKIKKIMSSPSLVTITGSLKYS